MLNRLLGATAIGALMATGASVVAPQVAQAQVADPNVACRTTAEVDLLDNDGNVVSDASTGLPVKVTGLECGEGATANPQRGIAVGNDASAVAPGSSAFGFRALAGGENSLAVGDQAYVEEGASNSIAIGQDARVDFIPDDPTTDDGNPLTTDDDEFDPSENAIAIGHMSRAKGSWAHAIGTNAQATGFTAVAVGGNAVALGDYTTALGDFAEALAENSTALGNNTTAEALNATVVGADSFVGEGATNSTAVGTGATILENARQSLAIGTDANVNLGTEDFVDTLGIDESVEIIGGTAIGFQASTTGSYATALGHQATADGFDAHALGGGTEAVGTFATAVGGSAAATGDNTTAVGNDADATAANAVSIGYQSQADTVGTTAIGTLAAASGNNATSVGYGTIADGNGALAIGSSGPGNAAVGTAPTQAIGSFTIAIGSGTSVTAQGGLAIGSGTEVSGGDSVVVGNSSEAAGDFANVLGFGSSAGFRNSTAIGTRAVATRANQMVFGSLGDIDFGANTYTMPGIVTQASRDVQTGPLELVTSDANGNLATDGGTIIAGLTSSVASNEMGLNTLQSALDDALDLITTPSDIDGVDDVSKAIADNSTAIESVQTVADSAQSQASANQARVARAETDISSNTQSIIDLNSNFETMGLRLDTLGNQVSRNTEDIQENRAGIAIANALAGTTWLQANETHAITGNWGYFNGTNAFAVTATQRLDKNWSINGGIGASPDEGEVGARAGFRLGW